MDAFANPFPGLVFFDLFLHAPADELAEINAAGVEGGPDHRDGRRRRGPPCTSGSPSSSSAAAPSHPGAMWSTR